MADNDNLNDEVEVVVQDADVVTVPIDDTLSNSGEAADAKAVGDALALKADKSELAAAVTVNGQGADAQGAIIVTANDTKMSSTDNTTIKAKIEAVDGKTAADIPMSSDPGAQTVAQAINTGVARAADEIPMSSSDPTTVASAIGTTNGNVTALGTRVTAVEGKTAADIIYSGAETIKQHVDGLEAGQVKTVYGVGPDASGDISPKSVPYAENLSSDEMEQVDDTFLQRATGGTLGISGSNAWILRLKGNRVHTGYTAESITMTVTPVPRTAPAAITAVLDAATFEAYVETAGTYTLTYDEDDGWSANPTSYGLTISNDPVDGDSISIVWDGENTPVTTVNAVPRETPDAITATIDRDTFVAYVSTSGTTTLTYTTSWSADPANYGITVTGDPINGDVITVVYVKEVRGTITQADPAALVSTGWNLYDHSEGYAKVVKYSTSYGYKIGGAYSAVEFVTEIGGTATSITPDANGLFTIPSDGYVVVSDGDATTTYVLATWSDWISGPVGGFKAYEYTEVDFSTIMSSYFPYGLCKVGTVVDEIDMNAMTATSRIQRTSYSAENLAAVKATGRAYEYDENYIWFLRSTPTVSSITIDPEYSCDDHGIEWFDESDVSVQTEILYGQNLKDKLRRQVVTFTMTIGELQAMGT